MANYRTTVILKTDIVDSTLRLADQTQAEMSLQRHQHKQFISETAVQHHGSVFQEEGDAYWIEFPSVTNAVLAAIDMHQNLRSMQAGKGQKQRLAIRAIITAGDILHQKNDTIGMVMSLTVRIEKLTPSDEIYLSHAAWLMLNKAEVQTSLVGEFNLKGFAEPERIYRVDQKSGIRVLADQCIVLADARGFSDLYRTHSPDNVEKFLLEYEAVIEGICSDYGGVIRQVNGDMYFLTFENAYRTLVAVRTLCLNWKPIMERHDCGISIGVHKGSLYIFRSYVFGNDINTAEVLSAIGRYYTTDRDRIFAAVSGRVRDEVTIRDDDLQFRELDGDALKQEIYRRTVREQRAYRLVVEDE